MENRNKVNAPLLSVCPYLSNARIKTGNHDLFIGAIEAVHCDSEKNSISFQGRQPIRYRPLLCIIVRINALFFPIHLLITTLQLLRIK